MRRVPGEQHPPDTQPVDHPHVDPVGGQPAPLVPPVRGQPGDLDVPEQHALGAAVAVEAHAEGFADRAAPAVTADQVPGHHALPGGESHLDPVGPLLEPGHLGGLLDGHPVVGQPAAQDLLRAPLRDDQAALVGHVRSRRAVGVGVDVPDDLAADQDAVRQVPEPRRAHLVHHAQVVENLLAAGTEPLAARAGERLGQPVHQPGPVTAPRQFARPGCAPRWAAGGTWWSATAPVTGFGCRPMPWTSSAPRGRTAGPPRPARGGPPQPACAVGGAVAARLRIQPRAEWPIRPVERCMTVGDEHRHARRRGVDRPTPSGFPLVVQPWTGNGGDSGDPLQTRALLPSVNAEPLPGVCSNRP